MSRVDVAKDYLLSVAERTIGMAGYQREWRAESISTPITDQSSPVEIKHARSQAVLTGLCLGLFQISAPVAYEGLKRFDKMDIMPLVVNGGAMVDFLATTPAVIFLSHGHLAEAILVKIAVNAATHVGLDILEAGINRFREHNPPSLIP